MTYALEGPKAREYTLDTLFSVKSAVRVDGRLTLLLKITVSKIRKANVG